ELGMAEIETGVQNSDFDSIAIKAAGWHFARSKAPGDAHDCSRHFAGRKCSPLPQVLIHGVRQSQDASKIVAGGYLHREHKMRRINRVRGGILCNEIRSSDAMLGGSLSTH